MTMPNPDPYTDWYTAPGRADFLEDLVRQFIRRRQTLGLSQEAVDMRMGNSERLCSKWECGLLTPTSFNLYCWAKTLQAELILTPPPGP